MAIRIDRIKINRDGPLEEDFKLGPGDINLIYGRNETGKTYIVEAIINLLFKTRENPAIDWKLRDCWSYAGRIVVSGLSEDGPVAFSKTGKKLEDYCEKEIGLPQDLSRLLVVKSGETKLLADEKDGVGRDILRNYLSGEGLLDRIGARISTTLQKARVQDSQIVGSNMGELRERRQLSNNLEKLNSLLKDAEDGYALGVIYDLQQKCKTLEAELERLEKAKRYHAWCLYSKEESLNKQKGKLPSEEKLSQIESAISVYEKTKDIIKGEQGTLEKLQNATKNYNWAEEAVKIYESLTSGQTIAGHNSAYMIIALIFLAGAAVTGFLNLNIPLAICAAGSIASIILYYMRMRRVLKTVGGSKELEKLKKEFKTLFGVELTDRALLEIQVKKLRKGYIRAEALNENLENTRIPDLRIQENSIKASLRALTNKELEPQQWPPVISELRGELNSLTEEINSKGKELASLAVEGDFLDQDPGIEWDTERYKELGRVLEETKEDLSKETEKLEGLKREVAREVDAGNTMDWEELLPALRRKHEGKSKEYRLKAAEILAKIKVNDVIQEFRKEENKRIASGLRNELLTKPLHAITGHYKAIRHEVDRGIVLTTDEDEEYPLTTVSTGAQEQAFLAMRIGFSSIIMKGQTAFLILDDAFQHSDWPRRTNLMDQVLSLVESGWQIFYFAMDDHIRDLFLKAGKKMGDRFKTKELC